MLRTYAPAYGDGDGDGDTASPCNKIGSNTKTAFPRLMVDWIVFGLSD